ncbi:DUF2911 domain-containing protein [Sphingobacterium corticis]|uniref:DUF2911 domain-containing protein n=1 Tax=Sphingobacterium corticis TaxID=1812823 RepID=A0ABW5NNN3_9SPHI
MKIRNYHFLFAALTAQLFLFACNGIPKSDKKEADESHEHHHKPSKNADAYIDSLNKGLVKVDSLKGSPQRIAMTNVGDAHIHISYRSPGVKDRVIWGGLVPYNQVWVTGAHSATSISFSHSVKIANQHVEAGTYAIFTIPGEDEWIFILNKNYRQHLADDYDEKEDVLRINVKPEQHDMTQRLTYEVIDSGENHGTVSIAWEKLKLAIPFVVQ